MNWIIGLAPVVVLIAIFWPHKQRDQRTKDSYG